MLFILNTAKHSIVQCKEKILSKKYQEVIDCTELQTLNHSYLVGLFNYQV